MNDLIVLILSLTSEDVDGFLAFAKAKNQRSDVKNIQLFQLLLKGHRKDLDIKIYGQARKNALHALANRLKQNLIDYTASKSLASDAAQDLQLLKQLLAARIFLEQEQYKLGFKILQKTITQATSLELHAILQECYHTYVQYAHLDDKVNLEDLIASYQYNHELYDRESKLVVAYARLHRELKSHPTHIFKVVKEQLDQLQISIDENLSYKSLFQLMNIATDAATLTSHYAGITIFMNHVYEVVNRKSHLVTRHVYYHSEILYLMSGTYFRNRDFEKSKGLLFKLKAVLKLQNGIYYNQFQERVQLLDSLIENYTGGYHKAIEIVSAIKNPSARIRLAHIMYMFQQQHFKIARRLINELHHSDQFYEKKEGLLWVLQKNILEIIIYIELNQPDMVESRLRSFKNRFSSRLKSISEDRVLDFLNLLGLYYDAPHIVIDKAFRKKVDQAFEWKPAGREDIFVISFYAYLKSKMERKPIYATTLELVASGLHKSKEEE